MSSCFVLTSHRPKPAAIGILLFIVAILFCAAALTFSTVNAEMRDKPPTELAQPEPTLVSSTQTAATVFLPLIAHESSNHIAAHEEAPPLRVTASSDRNGNSETPPPIANNHTFVTDESGYLDDYWYRFELPNGQLTFTIAITAPVTPVNAEYILADGSLTYAGLEYMMSRHKLSYLSSLQLHVFDVDHDAPDCAEVDSVSINGHPVGVLRSGDGEWNTWSMNVPTLFLRFPI